MRLSLKNVQLVFPFFFFFVLCLSYHFSHLRCLGLRVNFAKSILSLSQRVSFLGTVINSDDSDCFSGASHDNSAPPGRLPKAFQRILGLMAAASTVLQLGLLHMRPIQFWLKQRVPSAAWHHGHRVTVTRPCALGLARRKYILWLKQGVILDTAYRRKLVTTDASNKGWRVLCKGKPTFCLWSEKESGMHINCL